MKFSQKKKAKMRKIRQRRINRCCSNMIGCHIFFENEDGYVLDQAKINDIMYLLVKTPGGKYAICKIVKVYQYVKLSPKRVLQNKKNFSNYQYWENHSTIEINEDGVIQSVKDAYGRKNTYERIYFNFV